MKKLSAEARNTICPQTAYLLGTYKEDGTPNFGLFCWITYCWDEELSAVVSVGDGKLTRDRIGATGVFSANLVNEGMLPLADYFGNTPGYDVEKMDIAYDWTPGKVLPVPVLADSRWSYELEVKKTVPLDGGEIYICAIRNVLADEALLNAKLDVADRVLKAKPVLCMADVYFSVGQHLGDWGDWRDLRATHKEELIQQ